MVKGEDKLVWIKDEPNIWDGIVRLNGNKYLYPAVKSECHWCGNLFWHRDRPDRYKLCSRNCASKEQSKVWAQRRVNKRCVICKAPFKVRPSEVKLRSTCGNMECFRKRMSDLGKRGNIKRG